VMKNAAKCHRLCLAPVIPSRNFTIQGANEKEVSTISQRMRVRRK
jgi:hypothetical protein